MKKILVFALLLICTDVALFAQKSSAKPDTAAVYTARTFAQRQGITGADRDQRTIDGYLVRLTTTVAGNRGYGFNILNPNRSLAHRFPNPLPSVPIGIQSKEDAFKIAGWLIRDFKARGHWQNVVPPRVLSGLNIITDRPK